MSTASEVNPVDKVVTSALAVYAACHLPEPNVLVVKTYNDYQNFVGSFASTDNGRANRRDMNRAMAFLMVFALLLFCFPFSMCWLSSSNEPLSLLIVFGPFTLLSLMLSCSIHSSISEKEASKLVRLGLLQTKGVFVSKPLSADLLFRGAMTTPEAMVGALAGAIHDNGGQITRDPEGTESELQQRRLDIGREPDTTKRIMVIASIQNWVSRSTTSDQGGEVSLSRPVLLNRILELSGQADRTMLLEDMAIVCLAGQERDADVAQVQGVDVPVLDVDMSPVRIGFWYGCMLRCRGLFGTDHSVLRTRTLVRRASQTIDLVLQDHVYRQAGLDQVVGILDVKPTLEDDMGRLYRLGSNSSVLCYIRVEDKVMGSDNRPLVHWISVPQYISSPREGVAWSFALGEQVYKPTAEA